MILGLIMSNSWSICLMDGVWEPGCLRVVEGLEMSHRQTLLSWGLYHLAMESRLFWNWGAVQAFELPAQDKQKRSLPNMERSCCMRVMVLM